MHKIKWKSSLSSNHTLATINRLAFSDLFLALVHANYKYFWLRNYIISKFKENSML